MTLYAISLNGYVVYDKLFRTVEEVHRLVEKWIDDKKWYFTYEERDKLEKGLANFKKDGFAAKFIETKVGIKPLTLDE